MQRRGDVLRAHARRRRRATGSAEDGADGPGSASTENSSSGRSQNGRPALVDGGVGERPDVVQDALHRRPRGRVEAAVQPLGDEDVVLAEREVGAGLPVEPLVAEGGDLDPPAVGIAGERKRSGRRPRA